MPEEGVKKFSHRDILRFEEINRILKISRELGITKFRFTGGEVFLRKGVLNFFEKLPEGNYNVTTALAIDGLDIERINRLNFSSFNISCDSLKPDKYHYITRWGDFNVFLSNLEKLNVNDLKINVVVIKGFNEDEIINFIEFADKYQATVRFIEKMDFHVDELEHSSLTKIKEQLIRDGIIQPDGYRIHNSVSEYHSLTGRAGKVGFITPITRHFCNTCSKIRLKANGDLKLCVFSGENYNLRNVLRSEPDDEMVKKWLCDIVQHKPLKPVVKKNRETMAEIGG